MSCHFKFISIQDDYVLRRESYQSSSKWHWKSKTEESRKRKYFIKINLFCSNGFTFVGSKIGTLIRIHHWVKTFIVSIFNSREIFKNVSIKNDKKSKCRFWFENSEENITYISRRPSFKLKWIWFGNCLIQIFVLMAQKWHRRLTFFHFWI